jgi:23S rRNA (cytosine1962-C5)-methyltransferase
MACCQQDHRVRFTTAAELTNTLVEARRDGRLSRKLEQMARYDVVILDPPAFVKRRKDLAEGTLAYRRLNELGLTLLARDGLLVTSSCSFHMARDELLRTVQQAARHADRSLQLLEEGRQGPDHPVHPAMPETAYLKTFFLRVLPTF